MQRQLTIFVRTKRYMVHLIRVKCSMFQSK